MINISSLIVLVITLSSIEKSLSYSTGAPSSACITMMPNHGVAFSPNNPFDVKCSRLPYPFHQIVTVSISGIGKGPTNQDLAFKGFLAKLTDGTNDVGTYLDLDKGVKPQCNNQAATHTDSTAKFQRYLSFRADSATPGLKCRVTVVQTRTVIYQAEDVIGW